MLGQHGRLAGSQVHPRQGRRVAPAAVAHVEAGAVGADVANAGAERVLDRDEEPAFPPSALRRAQHVVAAVRGGPGRQARHEAVVGDEARQPRVLGDQRGPAGGKLDAEQVGIAGVALVVGGQHLAPDVPAAACGAGAHALGRQRPGRARVDAHGVQAPVLVAAAVLHEDEVAAVVGPVVVAHAAAGVARDRAGRVRGVERRDPDVHHAVQRRHPGQVRAIGADGAAGPVRVAEQVGARDQWIRHVASAPGCIMAEWTSNPPASASTPKTPFEKVG